MKEMSSLVRSGRFKTRHELEKEQIEPVDEWKYLWP